ncbi:MAG: pilin [Acidobacteria bacterium]|nr:pilin [Acidobacteriota bacterium]MCB9398781.1 pilin [Acidobacteriota bacterium]
MRKFQGFSLVELMVVIAIIATLASISLPLYGDFVTRAQVTESLSLVNDLKSYVKDFHRHTGQFPKTNAEAGVPEPNKLIGIYVTQIELENGAFHIQFGNRAHKALQGKILTIQPVIVPDSPMSPFSWTGGFADPPSGMISVGENRTDIDEKLLPYIMRNPRKDSSTN